MTQEGGRNEFAWMVGGGGGGSEVTLSSRDDIVDVDAILTF